MKLYSLGLILLYFLPDDVLSLPGDTKMCYACQDIEDHGACTHLEKCPERYCKTVARLKDGVVKYSFSCNEECAPRSTSLNSIIGKRERGHHEHGILLCTACCTSASCEKTACDRYQHFGETTTTRATTTTTTTKPPDTTTIDDHGCRNYESDVFKCSELDKYNFCTDSASVAFMIAHEKCKLHCGLCSAYGTTNALQVTDKTPTMMVSSHHQNTTSLYVPTTTGTPCVDNEQQQFNCAEWKSFGFCDATSGVGHDIALLRCQKTCGYCD